MPVLTTAARVPWPMPGLAPDGPEIVPAGCGGPERLIQSGGDSAAEVGAVLQRTYEQPVPVELLICEGYAAVVGFEYPTFDGEFLAAVASAEEDLRPDLALEPVVSHHGRHKGVIVNNVTSVPGSTQGIRLC